MSYCNKCGAYIPDRDDVCPACGTREGGTAAQAETGKRTEYQPAHRSDRSGEARSYSGAGGEARSYGGTSGEYRSFGDGAGASAGGAYAQASGAPGGNAGMYGGEYDADARENRSLGYLCYLGILFMIPFFMKPDSQFLRYHCNQGLVLMLFCILASVCSAVPILGWLGGAAGSVFAFYCLVKGLGNVARGKRSPLPLIGQITIIK